MKNSVKLVKSTKRVFAVLMAVLMVMSAWVFTPIATKASAATAGTYYVKITWQVTNKGGNASNAYTGGGPNKSGNSNNMTGISLFYKANNGTGNEYEVYWDCGKKSTSERKYGSSNSSDTVSQSTGYSDSDKEKDYTCTATIHGFPTMLFIMDDYNSFAGVTTERKKITKLEVGKSSSSLTTLWQGTMAVGSNTNAYGASISYDGTTKANYFGNTGSECYVNSNDGYKNWTSKMPKASSITAASISPTEVTCPTGSNTVTSTATLGTIKDQYGVNWYQDPYLSVAADPGITRTNNTTITVDSGAMVTDSPWYRKVTIRVRAGSSTGTQVGSDLSLKVINPQYTVTWKWYETNATNPASPTAKTDTTTGVYYNQTPTAPTDKTNNYYNDTYHYTAGKFTPSKITGATTFTMQYTSADHSYTNETTVAATCTDKGTRKYTCTCGYSFSAQDIAALGHSYTSKTTTSTYLKSAATCTEPAVYYYKCSRCSAKGTTTYTSGSALGHSLTKTEAKAATCTATGNNAYWTCSRCEKVFSDSTGATETTVAAQTLSALGHSYTSGTYKDDSNGNHSQKCTRCSVYGNATAHTWNNGTVTTQPTCTGTGVKTYTCTVCNATKTEALTALGHSYEFKGFTWTDTTSAVANFTCTRDNSHKTTATATITNAVTTAATCTETGVRTYTATATFEGKTYTDTKTETVAATGHTAGSGATCTTPQTCTVCGEIINSALGHTWNVGTVTTAPTCTEEGVMTYECTVCHETMTESIDALGHNLTKVNAKDATCTTSGNVEYWHCSRCSKNFSDAEGTTEIENVATNPTGHTPGAPATCETAQTCTKCGTILTAPLGHNYPDEWTIRIDATCTNPGLKFKKCTRCDNEISEVIPATGHTEVIDPAVEATCTESGLTQGKHCSVCNTVIFAQQTIPAKGHTEAIDSAVAPTTENVGLTEGKHCSACNTILVAQEIIAPLAKSEVYEGAITSKIEGTFIGVTATVPDEIVSTTELTADSSADGSYGTVTINNSGKATYKVTTMKVEGADTFWLLSTKTAPANNAGITTVYSYQKITVIPADRLYYEDTFEAGDNSGIRFSGNWTTVGNSIDSAVSQLEDKTFEEAYNSCLAYSAGNAKKVTVSKSPWPYVEFTFAGTGFDIISATSAATGTFTVTITGNGTPQKKIVDTYYGYEYGELHFDETNHILTLDKSAPALYEVTESDEFVIRANGKYYSTTATGNIAKGWIENPSNGNSLYQVPIISLDGLAYGVYTVKVEARYSSMFDHAKSGSYDLIFDAVRIHNPGGESVDDLRTETNTYISIREKAEINGNVLVDGAEVIDVKESDVLKVSPNNELYISKGQSLAFDLNKNGCNDVLVGMRSINGSPVSVTIVDSNNNTKTVTVSTATELYYSISEMSGTVTIRNNGNGILSLTDLKAVTEKGTSQAKSYMSVSAETAPRALAMLRMLDSDLSINPEEIETATDDSGKITLTVKTSSDVANLIIYDVGGNEVTADEINSIANGDEITWTVILTTTESGTYTYSIQGAYENGYTSDDPVEITVKVELPETAPEATPDDEDNEPNKKLSLFELIIRIIKRIIYKVFGVSYE